jgi:hypothetical protein
MTKLAVLMGTLSLIAIVGFDYDPAAVFVGVLVISAAIGYLASKYR